MSDISDSSVFYARLQIETNATDQS